MARNSASAYAVNVGSSAQGGPSGIHQDFARFRSEHPLLKAHLPRSELDWTYYQAGPPGDANPLIFLHGTSGTAAAFFYQVQALSGKGYRVLSVQYPAYNTPEEWSKGFDSFLDQVRCKSAHIFGAGLGGFLAQHFATRYPHRVRSMVLCNAFASTHPFAEKAGALAGMVHFTPTVILRKVVLDSFPEAPMTLQTKQAIDFVAGQVSEISGPDLAGRLSLNSTASSAGAVRLDPARITIIESSGETMVPEELRRELKRRYADARVAELKAGGDFPFLSGPEEVSLFVEVHMRKLGVFAADFEENLSQREAPDTTPVREAECPSRPDRVEQVTGNFTVTKYWGEDDVGIVAAAPEAAPPPRRPKWVNPFEEDSLL